MEEGQTIGWHKDKRTNNNLQNQHRQLTIEQLNPQ